MSYGIDLWMKKHFVSDNLQHCKFTLPDFFRKNDKYCEVLVLVTYTCILQLVLSERNKNW